MVILACHKLEDKANVSSALPGDSFTALRAVSRALATGGLWALVTGAGSSSPPWAAILMEDSTLDEFHLGTHRSGDSLMLLNCSAGDLGT